MTTEKNSTVETLRNIMVELYHINQRLEGVIHPEIHDQLTKLHDMASKELKPTLEQEENDWNKEYDALSKIQKENRLGTTWSVSGVKSSDMDKKTPAISKLSYESWGPKQVHEFDKPTELTWLEFWKLADKLIKASGDTHHIFIESLYQDKAQQGTTEYSLVTGS
jgi:hypothetical protein